VPPAPIDALLQQLNAETLEKLGVSAQLDHPAESGRAREEIIRRFLRQIMPAQFGIDTGFVIDATGAKSKQIDIVVYRDDYHPRFEIGGVSHFLVEAVVAVLENKTSLQSVDSVRSALANIRSVKRLDRTNRGKNYRVEGTSRGPDVNPDAFNDQIFGALVTENSLAPETLARELLADLAASPRRQWFNIYADVRGLSALYLKGSGDIAAPTTNTKEATRLLLANLEPPYQTPSLIRLGAALANIARVTSLIDYKPADYFEGATGPGRSWPLPAPSATT